MMELRQKKGIAGWVSWAINEKGLVYLIIAVLVAFGAVGLVKMNKDELPTFQIKQGLVAGIYPGASAAEVEEQLVKPLEETLFSYKEVNRGSTKSVSRDGICYIYVDLNCKQSEKDAVWSKIKLGLQTRKMTLPTGVLAVVAMDSFSEVAALLITIESDDKGYIELQEYADELCERLRAIPELAQVSVNGSQKEELAVTLDRERLSAYGVSPASLALNYKTATLGVPSGSFTTDYTNSPIHIKDAVNSEKEVSEHIVFMDPDGKAVRLKDIAKIERRLQKPSGIVAYNGRPCLVLAVEMRPDNNIVAFGEAVGKVLDDYRETLPPSVRISRISDQPKAVNRSIFNFIRDLFISILVVILVMLMLFPMKSALIASSGVPVCTMITLAVMYFAGLDLNTVTLAAMIVCLGMIVDDSIITMDGYMDKLRRGMDKKEAACASARELFMPTFVATLAICMMFFPMTGIIDGYLGDFVKTFPWMISIALMTSLVYAVTVVPSLEVRFITQDSMNRRKNLLARVQDKFFNFIQRIYESAQEWCFRHPCLTLSGGVIAVALGIIMFCFSNIQMMPMMERDFFAVEMQLENNKSLDVTLERVDSLQKLLLSDPRVESVTSFSGIGAPRFAATYTPKTPSPSFAQMIVNVRSVGETVDVIRDFENRYEHVFPDAVIRYKQMDYQGIDAQVMIKLKGSDREQLLPVADSIRKYLAGFGTELKWIHDNASDYESIVNVELDQDEASRLGINRTALALSLASSFDGQSIASVWEDGHEIPVNLYSEGISREMDYGTIGNQLIATSVPGVSVPLRQFASITPDWALSSLSREGGTATVCLYADVKTGFSQPAVMKKIKKYIDENIAPGLPDGVSLSYGGLTSTNEQLLPQIILSLLAAIAVLFLFLLFHFKKASLAVLTLTMSSLCLFGAFFGLWIFNLDIGMVAVLGLITLVGIIVRNGILLFEYAEDARSSGGLDVRSAALEAGKRRMRPIFLTSCTTALGVLPMIISNDLLWKPLGVVICFGTLMSIFLITLIMPVSYWQLYKKKDKK